MAGQSPLLSRIEVEGGVARGRDLIINASGSLPGNVNVTLDTKFSTFTWPQWGACGGLLSAPEHPECLAQANYAANQPFQLFVTAFYYLPAPEGWSFVAGDTDPF
jgi:hypothetical protein